MELPKIIAIVIAILILLFFSGLFSGLNLALLSLDMVELQVTAKSGSATEKRYAEVIIPVRRRGNYLLCSLMIGETLVDTTITVLVNMLTESWVAVIVSTVFLVIFGGIIPQALCHRHSLAVGAKTIWITYFLMIITFPLSYPISKALDVALGEEIGAYYDRDKIRYYIEMTKKKNDFETWEIKMLTGVLKFKKKPVFEVMTKLSDAFMCPVQAKVDFDFVAEVFTRGYSRIPIYRDQRQNIVGLIHTKDLVLIGHNSNLTLTDLMGYFKHPLVVVSEDQTIDKVFSLCKKTHLHMALVQKKTEAGAEVTGIITLEDVIEEILMDEINDESDFVSDNENKIKTKEFRHRFKLMRGISKLWGSKNKASSRAPLFGPGHPAPEIAETQSPASPDPLQLQQPPSPTQVPRVRSDMSFNL